VQLGQDQLATKYYNDTVKRSLDAKDYINAARLKIDKMGDAVEGQNILLDGWKDDNQPERCLARYFEVLPEEKLHDSIIDVYELHVGLRQKTTFLKVLADMVPKNTDPQFRETLTEISYEIVHQQVSRGDHSALALLGKFLPDDRLLGQDASRYLLQNHKKPRTLFATSYLILRQDTKWVAIINYHDQLIGVGLKNQELHLFRANWDGKIDYEFLFLSTDLNPSFQLIADAQVSSQVILTGSAIPLAMRKKMGAYSYFEKELNFSQLNWQQPKTLGYGLKTHEESVFVLRVDGDSLSLGEFSHDGNLLRRTDCSMEGEKISIYGMHFLRNTELYWRKEHFYFISENRLIRLDTEGRMGMLPLEADVIAFSISGAYAALKIAVLTTEGCVIVIPGLKEMVISTPAFAGELNAAFVQLLPDNRLVIASNELAMVYNISGVTPKLICEVQPENPIVRILSVPKRHHFALLETDNRISIHNVNEEV
jgi:hypothetical protein